MQPPEGQFTLADPTNDDNRIFSGDFVEVRVAASAQVAINSGITAHGQYAVVSSDANVRQLSLTKISGSGGLQFVDGDVVVLQWGG